MAYLDNSTILHASTDSAISATSYSANWIDLNITNGQGATAYRDLSRGGDLHALITITTAAAATAGTLEFQIVNTPKTTEAGMSQASTVIDTTADTFAWTAHGFPAGTMIQLSSLATSTGIADATPYFVAANGLAANTFKISTTLGEALKSAGTTVNIGGSNGTATVTAYPNILGTTGPIAPTLMTLGSQFRIRLSQPGLHAIVGSATNGAGSNIAIPEFRYLVARFVESGTITTVVPKVELILDPQDGQKFYPGGFAIS